MNENRKSNFFLACLLAIGLILSEIAPAAIAIPAQYIVTDLGTLGGAESSGFGINSSGQVTGRATIDSELPRAFLWSPSVPNSASGSMIDLGTLGGVSSEGLGINENGHVTGSSYISGDTSQHSFYYDGTTMLDLGTLGGTGEALDTGWGVNSSGQVVGGSFLAGDSVFRAFLYDGTMHDLGTLGGTTSAGFGINESGYVAGDADTGSNRHAFLYDGTAMHDLGTLGGSTSRGNAINESGQVTGDSRTVGNASRHAFLWTPAVPGGTSGTMLDMGTLGDTLTTGLGINANGDVVGNAFTIGGDVRLPFLYTSGTGMVDLNTLISPLTGWELIEARAINDVGQIVGSGLIGGEFHAYLLTPVPEPACLGLALIGSFGLFTPLRRRHSTSRR